MEKITFHRTLTPDGRTVVKYRKAIDGTVVDQGEIILYTGSKLTVHPGKRGQHTYIGS